MHAPGSLGSQFVEVGGMPLHYLTGGEGPPVLLIHGLGSSGSLEWRLNLQALTSRHRVIALDLPGFGRSAKPPIEYTVDFFVGRVAAFLAALDVPRLAVVGASLGGRVAVGLALQEPHRVARLCLVDALGFGRPRRHWAYMAMVVPGVGELMMRSVALGIRRLPPQLVRRLWATYLRRPRRYARLLPDAHLRDARVLLREPGFRRAYLGTLRALARGHALGEHLLVDAELARLQVPTLLVWGEEDRLFPPMHAREAAQRIAGARVEIFAGCGHTPQLEDAQRFNAVLEGFLGEG